VRARFSALVQISPGAHPASCTMGTTPFPGVKSGQGMTLTLLPLWAIQPVQSLSACTKVHLTFIYIYIYIYVKLKCHCYIICQVLSFQFVECIAKIIKMIIIKVTIIICFGVAECIIIKILSRPQLFFSCLESCM